MDSVAIATLAATILIAVERAYANMSCCSGVRHLTANLQCSRCMTSSLDISRMSTPTAIGHINDVLSAVERRLTYPIVTDVIEGVKVADVLISTSSNCSIPP